MSIMRLRMMLLLAGVACCVAGSNAARAADQILLYGGGRLSGTIESIASDKVILTTAGPRSGQQQVPVDAIEMIRFDGEPPELQVARSAIKAGRYAEATSKLEALAPSVAANAKLQPEVQFYIALAAAQEALSGAGGNVRDAGRLMNEFISAHGNSFHLLEARVLLGDLLAAVENYDAAMEQYAALTGAFWPGTQMRGHVARGKTLRAAGKSAEAQAEFERALEIGQQAQNVTEDVQKQVISEQRLAARLGTAAALADQSRYDEAEQMVSEVIREAEPENAPLHARAYNTLGNCLRAAGKPRDALLAFLHVDVLYSTEAQEHAEALANLVTLWEETGNRQRAGEARQQLETKYAKSKWAQAAGK